MTSRSFFFSNRLEQKGAAKTDPSKKKRFENGARVAEVLVYQPESFPRGLIGPAEILWQPLAQDKSPHNDPRRIWIRVHPSIFDQVFSTLKAVSGNILAEENLSKRVQALQLRDLRGELESFEIMGPKSGEVLRRVLRLCKSEKGVKSKVSKIIIVAFCATG